MGVDPSSPANMGAVAGKCIYPGDILFRVPELDCLLPENITGNRLLENWLGEVATFCGRLDKII